MVLHRAYSLCKAFETIRHATSDPPKLYLVKGKENIWAVRIPAEISSLNQEDCFLLDPGNMYDVFLLCGKGASSKEKETARKLGKAILVKQHNDPWGELKTLDGNFNPDANDSVSKAFIENLEQSTQEDKDIFWNYGEDSDFEKKREAEILLYKISDDGKDDEDDEEDVYGELLRGAQLTNNVLIPSECLVVDTNSVAGIQVYIGESAGPGVTFKALTQALATAASRATSLNVDKNEVEQELKHKIHILHHKRVPRTPDFVFNSIELTKEYLKYEDPAAALSEAVEKTTLE